MAPAVSVVLATHNRAARLERLLGALRAQTLEPGAFEVVVVDNASHDATGALLDAAAAAGDLDLRVVRRARAGGAARGRDDGWRTARAPLVAFTDDDCEPRPGWLEALLQASERAPGTLLAGRVEPNPAELEALSPFARTLQVDGAGPWYPTANIAYPRALLEQVGGFDRGYVLGGEDTDLAWRALDAGARAEYVVDAVVDHAVWDLGPWGALRLPLRWSDGVRLLADHPARRREVLLWGLFWKEAHRDLLLGALGLALARRLPPLLLLGLPWLAGARRRLFLSRGSARHVPWLVAHDAVECFAVARGALRHRVAVL
ncbi:MAG TPA: glycosyltransferase [Solirubrobacteraceae bacterium]|nr:glycosyltransferase [Solirubrobacteraceae bacterium]